MRTLFSPPSYPRSIVCFGEHFTEGQIIPFMVLKQICMPDGEEYYLLQSHGRNRFLLPYSYYQEYGITSGKEIKCRIDKINCSGRIFLEPIITTFEVGKYYGFKVVGVHVRSDRKNRQQVYYQLIDKDGKIQNARLDTETEVLPGSGFEGIFEKTRKGILVISHVKVINIC